MSRRATGGRQLRTRLPYKSVMDGLGHQPLAQFVSPRLGSSRIALREAPMACMILEEYFSLHVIGFISIFLLGHGRKFSKGGNPQYRAGEFSWQRYC